MFEGLRAFEREVFETERERLVTAAECMAIYDAWHLLIEPWTPATVPSDVEFGEVNRLACNAKLDCGGGCVRAREHDGDHMGIGDDAGEPGSCPA